LAIGCEDVQNGPFSNLSKVDSAGEFVDRSSRISSGPKKKSIVHLCFIEKMTSVDAAPPIASCNSSSPTPPADDLVLFRAPRRLLRLAMFGGGPARPTAAQSHHHTTDEATSLSSDFVLHHLTPTTGSLL
jgi:hypothetical protein